MKKILTAIITILFVQTLSAQEYSDVIGLESKDVLNATFAVTGIASDNDKDLLEENAKKSIVYNILYKGVEGVNDGKAIVIPNKENKEYTASFFNSEARYKGYMPEKGKAISKAQEINGRYMRSYRIEVQLARLVKDLNKNANDNGNGNDNDNYNDNDNGNGKGKGTTVEPIPFSIIIIPYKTNKNESYAKIYETNSNLKTACTKIQEAFQRCGIETQDIRALVKRNTDGDNWGEELNSATSNERELLRNADADIYVEVDLQIVQERNGKAVSITLNAYETSTANYLASTVINSEPRNINNTNALCADALKGQNIRVFAKTLEEKVKNNPLRMMIDFTLSNDADFTFRDRCKNGKTIESTVREFFENNTYVKDFAEQGGRTTLIYDRVMVSRADSNGKKMSANKFAGIIGDALYEAGISCDYNAEGNKIYITVTSIE